MISNLSNDEIADLKFHLRYSYFTVQRFEQAKPLLNTIRQMPKDPNYLDANYYYGFISFYDHNYSDALEAFTVVEDHDNYKKSCSLLYFNNKIFFKAGGPGNRICRE